LGAEADLRRHAGYYLVGAGRPELRAALDCREPAGLRLRQWVYRHHTALYLSGIALLAASSLALWVRLAGRSLAGWLGVCLGILLLGPSTQIAQEIVNYLVTRLLPPRTLPKMDFQKTGIPDAFRTLVVAPILMSDQLTIQVEAERLEIRFLANPEPNLLFSMFTDFSDADHPTRHGCRTCRRRRRAQWPLTTGTCGSPGPRRRREQAATGRGGPGPRPATADDGRPPG
jgi:cyclic beta-1,2-glucan synthetase